MKNILTGLCLSLLLLAVGSCSKDENKIYFEGGTPPELKADVTGSIPLSFMTDSSHALKLSWTNPEYKFTTGVSSQSVSYLIEMDTVGANFSNPNKKTVAISAGLDKSFFQYEINDYLLNQLNLEPDMSHEIEIRVISQLGGNNARLVSNVLRFTATPYKIPPKVAPPASGKLFITGSATPGDWQSAGDPELLSQQFTKESETLFVLPSITLNGGGSYLFVPVYGSWDAKYGYVGENNKNNVDGDEFKPEGGDMLAPPTSGNYKIEVDFQRGKFTVTKL